MKIKGDKQDDVLQLKFLVIGESCIGKTCVIERYVNNTFKENYIATIGVDVHLKKLEINNCNVELAINDTPGEERFPL